MISQETARRLLDVCKITLELLRDSKVTHETWKECGVFEHHVDSKDTGQSSPLSYLLRSVVEEASAQDLRKV